MWPNLLKALLNLFVESAANDQTANSESNNMHDVNQTVASEQGCKRKELTPRRKQSTQAKQLTARNKNALARVTIQENKITPHTTTRSLNTQANHLDFTKPFNYLLLWYNYILKQLLCIIIKIPNNCRELVVLCPDVTQWRMSWRR